MNFQTWGMSGSLTTQHDEQRAFAEERLWYWIAEVDAACNRFTPSSEISRLNANPSVPMKMSATFELALVAALEAYDATEGLCDPTILPALLALGYDRDYDELVASGDVTSAAPVPSLGRAGISLDYEHHLVTLTPGCQLDLGSSAKALVVDQVASDVAPSGGVVVEIGGDVAVRGRGPDGPWVIGVAESLTISGSEPRVSIGDGGIATSSSTTRIWRVGDQIVNHIIDPRTGTFAASTYAVATISANSCRMANAFATAALLWGEDAGYYISQAGWSGRLVRHDGTVEFVGGWPREEETPS